MIKSKVGTLRCVKLEPSRASDARKGVCSGFLGVPVVFFELETQEKECAGGSWEYPWCFSSFRRKKRSVLGVLGSTRDVF